MKVRCPECGTICSVNDAKVPEKGLWARCPQCRKRILVKKDLGALEQELVGALGRGEEKPGRDQSEDSGLKSPPVYRSTAPRPPRRTVEKTESSPGPPRSLKTPAPYVSTTPGPSRAAGKGQEAQAEEAPERDIDWAPPNMLPDTGTGAGWYVVLGLLFLISFAIGYIGLRKPAIEPPPKPPQKTAVQQRESDLALFHSLFTRDINFIRRKIIRRNYTGYQVSENGAELRALYDMFDVCNVPCQAILKADIIPLTNRFGFEAKVRCGEGQEHKVIYRWNDDSLAIGAKQCR
ncbi:MAG: zinc-ribbon domain-containing protein [Pseudomonadota bacterium]